MDDEQDWSERELVRLAQRGDAPAMERLLTTHEREIYRFGLRMCGDPEDAREVLQETLLGAFRHLSGFRGEAALSTWLYQIARSHCQRLRRRHPGEPTAHEELDRRREETLPSPAAGPEERAHAREIGEALQIALQALPDSQREVILLRDVEGLGAEEAASVIGIEIGTLKSRLHRARIELRRRLQPLLDGPDVLDPCPELALELSALAAGDADEDSIDQAVCARLSEHLARCPRCTSASEDLRRTTELCRQIPGGEVPVGVRQAVRRAIQDLARAPG